MLGRRTQTTSGRAGRRCEQADDLDPAVGLRWFALGAAAAGSLWDDQATFDLSGRWERMARAAGAFTTLPVALVFHAVSESMAGHFREADTRWALMLEVLTMSSGPGVLGVDSRSSGLLLAYRGHLTEARATGLAQVRESAARGQGGPADIGRYIVAMADLFAGDYEAAMSYAQTVIDDDPAYTAEGTLPELIEAAVRAGHYEAAATAHKTLSERALAASTPWALGLRARCEALLAEDAEGSYLESISQLRRCRMAVDLARTHLHYGQWLRRVRRRRDARHELRTAHDMFAAMGADRFAEQAAAELRATGERARARTLEAAVDLTPQETRGSGPRRGRSVGQRNRRAAVHQPEHRRLSPPQGVPQAPRDVAVTARQPAEIGDRVPTGTRWHDPSRKPRFETAGRTTGGPHRAGRWTESSGHGHVGAESEEMTETPGGLTDDRAE